MSITVITGPEKSGKTALAQTLRGTAINNGRGCLLLDETTDGDTKHLIEKLIVGEVFPDNISKYVKAEIVDDKVKTSVGLDALPWKKDPLVIVVGDKGKALLAEIEKIAPGFIKKFGPATGTSTTVEELDLASLAAPVAEVPNG